MAARTNSVDPRAERVRARLRDAAFALAHEQPVDRLTVGDIVARAGVSRQVFYQHFRDRDDAVGFAFSAAFASATADLAGDPGARILALFDFAAEHRAMYRNIVPSAVTQRVVIAFRAELAPACEEIAAAGMPAVSTVASLTPEAVSRFLVGGFMEVLRDWMEDQDATDLRGRVSGALDTVSALLGLSAAATR
ncbi:MAG TPA: TetR/AcrR family transcriptional regulator [Mycobacterium sp.]|jgi:AcrR family transcriptional regulator|nr:TetR/AcrR family transcriptional regulator [Mycobacterium sp.]